MEGKGQKAGDRKDWKSQGSRSECKIKKVFVFLAKKSICLAVMSELKVVKNLGSEAELT